jgi:hypothetical protein
MMHKMDGTIRTHGDQSRQAGEESEPSVGSGMFREERMTRFVHEDWQSIYTASHPEEASRVNNDVRCRKKGHSPNAPQEEEQCYSPILANVELME